MSMATITEEVIYLFKKGDERAFGVIFGYYWIFMKENAYKITQNGEAAKTIASDTFLNLWRSRTKITDEHHLKSFLYVTNRNLCLNALRKTLRDKFEISFDPIWMGEDDDGKLGQENSMVDFKMDMKSVLVTIANMPKRLREIMAMSIVGYNAADISHVLGIKEQSVRNRYMVGREMLLNRL